MGCFQNLITISPSKFSSTFTILYLLPIYNSQIWGLHDTTNSHQILPLQKAAPRTPSIPIFTNLEILNFFNMEVWTSFLYLNIKIKIFQVIFLKHWQIHSTLEITTLVFSRYLQLKLKTMTRILYQNLLFNNWIIPLLILVKCLLSNSSLSYTSFT